MKRLMIIGGPGAGKSILAKRAHAVMGLPLYHLDKLYWQPGWVASPREKWWHRIAEIAASDEWIMDGGYDSSFHLRMPHADTTVWLDLPRHVCFARVLKRLALNFGRVRQDVAPGCPERLDLPFLTYAWTFKSAHAAKYRLALNNYAPHAHVHIFTTSRQADGFIHTLSC